MTASPLNSPQRDFSLLERRFGEGVCKGEKVE